MSEPARVTFKLGGFKRPALNNLASASSQFDTSTSNTNDQQLELVTGFDNGELKGNAPVVKKKELVIPSQPNAHNQFFKMKIESKKKTTSNGMEMNQLEDEAKRALILDAQAANEAWNERNENGPVRVHTIEQDSANTFMINTDEENNAKEPEEEKEVENADYEQVPIEDFGMAVLRGMGYKEDSGLGISNKKQVDVFVPETRPRGLGLGADRKVLEKINQLKRNLKQAGIDEKDDLCFEKGAFVLIEKGPHQDLYGTIESIDEDVTRLTVSLAVSGTNKKKEVISISQYSVKLVTEKEFLKYSKYVNKSKADRVDKETSERLIKDYHRSETKSTSSGDDRDRERDRKHHRSSKNDDHDRKHHRHRDDDRNRSKRH
ncbi:unnamed protein product [Adineta ricciae]|uniref:G-patch domain-containing protein n=1 Tax=Adineta ricciae TaxID=249248 RepID=A0A814A9F5_ADIRI|nr:unnamed protein product [Adineta ricciae]CAF0909516.1 unnamed protein product [Adineta ricciae]